MSIRKEFEYIEGGEKKEVGFLDLEIENLPIRIITNDQRHVQYIERVAYPHIKPSFDFEGLLIKATIRISDQLIADPKKFVRENELIIEDSTGTLQFGQTNDGKYFIASDIYQYLNLSWEEGGIAHHICSGQNSEYGAVSIIKMHLLKEYNRRLSNLSIFHASSITHIPTGTGFVFSTADRGKLHLRKHGKTTSALSCLTDSDKTFQFNSNDEVVMGVNEQNTLNILPFPNEIPIDEATLHQEIDFNAPELESWIEENETTKKRRFFTTAGALNAAGYSVGKLTNINHWFFLDLDYHKDNNKIELLPISSAKKLFFDTVLDKRMEALNASIHLGEQTHLTSNEAPIRDIDLMFNLLLNNGVRFWDLSGGTNFTNLRKTIKQTLK